jgi:hypothetical protein
VCYTETEHTQPGPGGSGPPDIFQRRKHHESNIAWPAAAVILALLFRESLVNMLDRLKTAAVEYGKLVKEIENLNHQIHERHEKRKRIQSKISCFL